MPDNIISNVSGGPDLEAVRKLFAEYGANVSRAYCLKGFDEELAGLPGAYGAPRGALFLVRSGDDAAGCIAARPLSDDIAEMKRLYVRSGFQGKGYGRQLVEAVILWARDAGYAALRLDTLGHMAEARALYLRLGFLDIPAYHADTAPGMHFMELAL
ncbi:MAG: GNAT family N-acetyltransferase [Rhodospirillales bacterium]